MIKTFATVTAVILALGGVIGSALAAEQVTDAEKELCLTAIKDMTNGNPPSAAVALCAQGKTAEAMEKAMSAQGQ